MQMQVIFDARSADPSQVEAKVEALWTDFCSKDLQGELGQREQLEDAVLGQLVQGSNVGVWRDHEMTAVIWEPVHQHEGVPSSVEQEIGRIAAFV
jgi:hypothetical protein